MGLFRRRNPNWTDKTALQTWIPMLIHMFVFDTNDQLIHFDQTCFTENPSLFKGQLSTLTILLKGKTGVNKRLLRKLKIIYNDCCQDSRLCRE